MRGVALTNAVTGVGGLSNGDMSAPRFRLAPSEMPPAESTITVPSSTVTLAIVLVVLESSSGPGPALSRSPLKLAAIFTLAAAAPTVIAKAVSGLPSIVVVPPASMSSELTVVPPEMS